MIVALFADFGLPEDVKAKPVGPHYIHVTWKKATGPVIGYKIHCFPGESQQVEIIKDISNVDQKSALISGLKPNQPYHVGVSSATLDARSKLVFTREQVRMGKNSIQPAKINKDK